MVQKQWCFYKTPHALVQIKAVAPNYSSNHGKFYHESICSYKRNASAT